MTFAIRNATRADIALLATIIRDSFRDVADRFDLTSQNCPTHPSNCTTEWIEKALEKGEFEVAGERFRESQTAGLGRSHLTARIMGQARGDVKGSAV